MIDYPTRNAEMHGKYGAANSAGVILNEGTRPTATQAERLAKRLGCEGWLGECWAVKFVPMPVIDPEPMKPWNHKGNGATLLHVWNLLTECVTFGEDAATLVKVCGYNPLRTHGGEFLVSFPFTCWARTFRQCEAAGYRLGVAEYKPDSQRVRELIEECEAAKKP